MQRVQTSVSRWSLTRGAWLFVWLVRLILIALSILSGVVFLYVMIDAFNSHLERDWYFTTFQEDSGLRTAVTFVTFFLATIFGFFAKRLGSMARRSLRSETYAYMVLRGLATVVVVIVGLWAGYIILQQEVL